MTPLRRFILTYFLISQSLWSVAQYHVHFDKDGKLEKVTQSPLVGDPKVCPSLLSNEELRFEIGTVELPKSAFWKPLQSSLGNLLPGPFVSNPSNDILNSVRTVTIGPLWVYFNLTTLATLPVVLPARVPTAALKYDPTNLKLPIKIATIADLYKIETTEYDHELNRVSRKPLSMANRDRVEYKLIRNKLDNDIVQQHLEKTARNYKGWPTAYDQQLLELRQKFRNQGWQIDAVLIRDSLQNAAGPTMHPYNANILVNLDSLTHPIKLTDRFYRKVLTDNKAWIESWLWYTGGEVRLNPFPYADPAKLMGRADREIKELESEIGAMANREVSLNESGQKDRLAFLLSRLATLKQAREDLAKANEDYKKWLTELSVESEILYSGVWHGSSQKEIRWLYQFDAARDFRYLNDKKLLPNMIASQDQAIVYVHNLKADDKVAVTPALTPFQPKSELENTADAIATELAKAVGSSSSIQSIAQLVAGLSSPTRAGNESTGAKSTNAARVLGIDRETFNKVSSEHQLFALNATVEAIDNTIKTNSFYLYDSRKRKIDITYKGLRDGYDLVSLQYRASILLREATNQSDSLEAQRVQDLVTELGIAVGADRKAEALRLMFSYFDVVDQTAYTELIQDYVNRRAELVWLSAQTVPILSLKLEPDKKPIYSTFAEFPEKKVAIESSNKVAYTLTLNEKTTVARQTYSKYFTSKFMPSFGLVYVFEDRSALRFDETTGQFKPQEKDFDHIEALVGVKWYPGKVNPARTWRTFGLISKSVGRWANLSRGSGILNNFYVSGGLGVRRQLLRNYYLGAGLDLIPGLSIQGGGNFILQKQYELENGKIKNEVERLKSAWYLGLGLDLGLVTNLIRLLIP